VLSIRESSSTSADHQWQQLRNAISPDIGEIQMARWFNQVHPHLLEDGILGLEVGSRYALERIQSSYGEFLQQEADRIGLAGVQMSLSSSDATLPARERSLQQADLIAEVNRSQVDTGSASPLSPTRGPAGLRHDHTLERFVVGHANRVAHSAAIEVLRTPGASFNPLFLHGGSGLGKTHLLQAITREFFIQGERSIRYLPAENFVQQFIRALRNKTLPAFRAGFRELKVLAIDDIQAFAGKPSSQQELLETVDALAQQGGQVLLACDVPPRKLDHLHQQLQNRFVAGLVVLVDPPDQQTRVSILRQEVLRGGIKVPEEVIQLIASQARNSVRELLGLLVRIVAECKLSGVPVTMQRTRTILEPIAASLQRRISLENIVDRVAVRWGVPPEEIVSRSKTRNTSMARNVAMYLARLLTEFSLSEIGSQLGGRTHSTVSSSCRKIQGLISSDRQLRDEIESLLRDLRG